MKKVRLLALVVVLMAVFANSGQSLNCELRCDSPSDPSLCTNGEDTGCDAYCATSFQCEFYGFTNVHGGCGGASQMCVCRGCPPV